MINTPKTLLLQVLTMSPAGIGLSEKLQTNSRKNSLDFARIKCLPKRLLSAAMVADFSLGLTTTFAAMFLNVGRLFFFSRENKMSSQRI